MRVLFVMDPVSTVAKDADTSFAIMEALEARGHRADHALVSDVHFADGEVRAHVRRARTDRSATPPILLGDRETVALSAVDVVLVRKDPPFDDAYLWLTLLLDRVGPTTRVINDPRGLRAANEKLYALHFASVTPPTIVAADRETVADFVRSVGGRAVIKPVDGHGGEGVFALTLGDPNFNAIVEHVTRIHSRVAMVQRFIPEVAAGDKRILLLAGEPLGALLRVPQGGDVRSNLHVGGRAAPGEVTERDREIIAAVSPKLAADGLVFVGLDVIGGLLTEVNVTSPTGIQQMSRFVGANLADRVAAWLERGP